MVNADVDCLMLSRNRDPDRMTNPWKMKQPRDRKVTGLMVLRDGSGGFTPPHLGPATLGMKLGKHPRPPPPAGGAHRDMGEGRRRHRGHHGDRGPGSRLERDPKNRRTGPGGTRPGRHRKRCGRPTGSPSVALRRTASGYRCYTLDHLLSERPSRARRRPASSGRGLQSVAPR